MALSRASVQRAGDRAFLVSRPITSGTREPVCLSFWYYMYEPIVDNTGPNLGKLAVWTKSLDGNDKEVMTPLWRLQNGQGPSWKYAQARVDAAGKEYEVIFEGVWGNNRVSGYIAVDDVTFFEGECDSELFLTRWDERKVCVLMTLTFFLDGSSRHSPSSSTATTSTRLFPYGEAFFPIRLSRPTTKKGGAGSLVNLIRRR